MDLYEVMRTTPATREFAPDPLPSEVVERILDHARFAASGRNAQPWRVIVVRDPELKAQLAELYRSGIGQVTRASGMESDERMSRSAGYLIQHLAEAPVLLIATVRLADAEAEVDRVVVSSVSRLGVQGVRKPLALPAASEAEEVAEEASEEAEATTDESAEDAAK